MQRHGIDSYIVRIYRRDVEKPGYVVGLVEEVERRERRGFKSIGELWAILTAPERAPSRKSRTSLRGANRAKGSPRSDGGKP